MKNEEIKQLIINSFRENNNSHAFLFVTNNINECYLDVIEIIKKINCDKEIDNCDCSICHNIDNNESPDFIIVTPENYKDDEKKEVTIANQIKTNQIVEMMDRFKTLPTVNKYNTYVIKYADRLNDTSANKILKFLEEPEDRIIGFFITDNIQGIIPTIKSRCEIYNINYNIKNIVDILNINESQMKFYDIADNITNRLNGEPKFKLMSDVKNITKYERGEIDIILRIIRQMYIIKYMYIVDNEYNDIDFIDRILVSIETNDINLLLKRIKLLDSVIEYNNCNVNKDLVINKLFLEWV